MREIRYLDKRIHNLVEDKATSNILRSGLAASEMCSAICMSYKLYHTTYFFVEIRR